MEFKTDKSLVCEFCGHPVKHSFNPTNKTIFYICSNGECSNGKEAEVVAYDSSPDWVCMKLGKKIWSE